MSQTQVFEKVVEILTPYAKNADAVASVGLDGASPYKLFDSEKVPASLTVIVFWPPPVAA